MAGVDSYWDPRLSVVGSVDKLKYYHNKEVDNVFGGGRRVCCEREINFVIFYHYERPPLIFMMI